jgi:hypothetical protein
MYAYTHVYLAYFRHVVAIAVAVAVVLVPCMSVQGTVDRCFQTILVGNLVGKHNVIFRIFFSSNKIISSKNKAVDVCV